MVDLFFRAVDVDAHLLLLHAFLAKDEGYFLVNILFDFFGLGIGFEGEGVVLMEGALKH